MPGEIRIGGQPVVTLRAPGRDSSPGFVSADVLPGRGMMTLQLRARSPGLGEFDLLASPPINAAARLLDGGADDYAGSKAFSVGAAILAPYANRIRGRLSADGRTLEADVLGEPVRLPANWGGNRPGAERYAMHGLILDAAVAAWRVETRDDSEALRGELRAGDFGGRWLSRCRLNFEIALARDAFAMRLMVTNEGREPLPMGVGWHPWFRLPSGRRDQARLTLPAAARTLVNDYDEVLPTGRVVSVAGTPYDFRQGAAMGDLHLDDCFTDLAPDADGLAVARLSDPASGMEVTITSPSPPVRAIQVYAPTDRAVVVIEPQFNLANPFGVEWGGRDTGMVLLEPGASAAYEARVQLSVR